MPTRPSSRQRSLRCFVVVAVVAVGCSEPKDEPIPGSTTEADVRDSEGSSSTSDEPGEASTTGNAHSDSGVASTGPAEPQWACEDESECVLHSDCCSCTAVHADEPIPACDRTCDRNVCESWGITELLCAHTCHIRLLECDAAMVTCERAPPGCGDGFTPSVDERCWSGYCIPTELCRP
jgi:hypothetical protein